MLTQLSTADVSQPVKMDFHYDETFRPDGVPEADAMLFTPSTALKRPGERLILFYRDRRQKPRRR